MGLTFKKEARETGLAGISQTYPNTKIKFNKQRVGTIYAPNRWTERDVWKITLYVKNDKIENCPWKDVTFKASFETEEEARVWLKEKWAQLNETYEIYPVEDF